MERKVPGQWEDARAWNIAEIGAGAQVLDPRWASTGMEGPGARAVEGGGSGHLDDPQGYSGGRGKRGGGLTRACARNCLGWKEQILKKGVLLRSSVGVLSTGPGQTAEVSHRCGMNGDWAEGTLLGSRRHEGCSD